MKVILALDQGTTSSRAIVFDHHGEIIALAQKEFRQIFPQPGWVEHDADEIWSSQISVAYEALAKARLSAKDVAAIGIANQRETTVLWDRATGEACGECDCLARSTHRIDVRAIERSRPRRFDSAENRLGDRCLFFRDQTGLVAG